MVADELAPVIEGSDATAPAAAWERWPPRIRNLGRPGVGFMALSAVDVALWDLKARLLGLPLVETIPAVHDSVPVYGSGGFCNYPLDRCGSSSAAGSSGHSAGQAQGGPRARRGRPPG